MHYHAWTRSGRVFTMHPRAFDARTTAHDFAKRRRPAAADRLVLACDACPESAPSKRRPASVARRAATIAAELRIEVGAVRAVLDADRAIRTLNR